MTLSSDSYGEMGTDLPLDDPALADVLAELRSLAEGPVPPPTGALMALLEGDVSCPTVGAPAAVPTPPSTRRKKKMLVSDLLAGLATKLAGLGLVAKAALGLGVATAAVTTAGVAGVLPYPAQHAVSTVVSAISPLELPDGGANAGVNVDVDVPDPNDVTLPGAGDDLGLEGDEDGGDEGVTHERAQNHGACVSAVARDHTTHGRDHGAAVSEAARSDCGKDATTTSSSTTTTTSSVPGGDNASIAGQDDNHGPGNSGGNGNSGRGGANRGPSNKSGSGRR